jgi:transposase
MLGHRDPQQSLFAAQNLPHCVPTDSFYVRMGAVSATLFQDDDLKELYHPDNGRPSLPPSLLSGVLLLQFYDDVSDEEAVARCKYDLRWKVALNLPLDFAGFDPSSLTYYRARLLEHQKERYAFDRLLEVGREAGFIPDKVTLLTDTTWVKGAGAVQDTYTLIRKAIRKLLKQLGYALPGKRHGLADAARQLIATYLDTDRKANIDWADPQQRADQLKVLVQDAEAALDLALEHADDAEVRTTGWLLTKILGDDIVQDDNGNPQIAEGTAPERIISITEPEMRHGRKSAAQRFNGFKTAVATEADSELILDIQDIPAPGSDGEQLLPTIQRVEAQAGVIVERTLGDGAYGSGENRAACANYPDHPVDLLAPMARPADPQVHKSAFQIDRETQTATCPEGQTVQGRDATTQGQPVLQFEFERATCEACPLFARCVKGKVHGRTVSVDAYESYRQAARQRQDTAEFKTLYPTRSRVERKQAELVHHGLRNTRYLGQPKRQFQRLWTAAAVNLKRLFKLAETRKADLATTFGRLNCQPAGLMLA